MNTPAIAFAETREQWDALTRHRARSVPQLQIIPATPETDYLAERAGEPYRTVEEFCTQEELSEQGDRNVQLAEEITDAYDTILHSTAGRLPRHEWVSLRCFFHPLKGCLDTITNRSAPVLAAFDELSPERVVCFSLPEYRAYGASLTDKPLL